MKTIIKSALLSAMAVMSSITLTAQVIPQGGGGKPFPKNNGVINNGPKPMAKPPKGNNNSKWWVSVGVGGGPGYGPGYGYPHPHPYYPPNYGGYYGGAYNYNNNFYYGGGYVFAYRKAARRMIRNTAYLIYSAIQRANWQGMYNLALSNAVQHQQYAQYLYGMGDYMGAMYHSKRANYLAWQSMNFDYYAIPNPGYDGWDDDVYNSPYNGNGGGYYGDDYRQSGSGGTGNGQKQSKQGATPPTTPSNEELDKRVPQKNMTKEEMQKLKMSDLDVK